MKLDFFDEFLSVDNSLQGVYLKTWPDYQRFSEVNLVFEQGNNLLFQYNTNTEEIVVKKNITVGKNYRETDCDWLKSIYGWHPLWIWVMKNQQGYADAIQLEFTRENLQGALILQLKSEGSIRLYKVQEIEF